MSTNDADIVVELTTDALRIAALESEVLILRATIESLCTTTETLRETIAKLESIVIKKRLRSGFVELPKSKP